jgi:PKD repeat protein
MPRSPTPSPYSWSALIALVLLGMLLSTPSVLVSHGRAATPMVAGATPWTGTVSAVPTPSACGGNLSGPSAATLTWSPAGTNNSYYTYTGSIPANLTAHLSFDGPIANYTWVMDWGDWSNDTGAISKNQTGPFQFNLTHTYNLEGWWTAQFNVTLLCQGGGPQTSTGGLVIVYGPYGASELTAGENVTSGTVPLDVRFNATIRGAPAYIWTQWAVAYPDGQMVKSPIVGTANATASNWNVTLTRPGTVNVLLTAWYPGAVVWDEVYTPPIVVDPLANLYANHSNPVGLSPWNLSFGVVATNLDGSPYTGNGSFAWNFTDFDVAPANWQTGPTTGSSLWHQFFVNSSNGTGGGLIVTALVAWDGTVLGEAFTWLYLSNLSAVSGGPALAMLVSPPNGTAPLATQIGLNLSGVSPPNGSSNAYEMFLEVQNFATNTTSVLLNYTPWTTVGAWVSTSYTFPNAGHYLVSAVAREQFNGSWLGIVGTSGGANVSSPTSTAPPSVALSVSASNSTGGTGLALAIDVAATGGTPGYNLTVCGVSGAVTNTSTCSAILSIARWNGTATQANTTVNTTGNYTIVATVQDGVGQTATASASVFVPSPPKGAPLSVSASVTSPAAGSLLGATFYFQTTVTGGIAPYAVQWAFGDGALGSALPGQAATHAYRAAGTYTATLTVTDARGAVARATVGPITISLPTAGASLWSEPAAQAILVGVSVGALLAVAALGRWAVQHREAVNWRRSLEPPEEATVPPRQRP